MLSFKKVFKEMLFSGSMKKIQQVKYIIVHHTERNNDFPFFVRLRHKYLRGWDDVGYHYLIGNTRPFTKDGKLYRGRSEDFEGSPCLWI